MISHTTLSSNSLPPVAGAHLRRATYLYVKKLSVPRLLSLLVLLPSLSLSASGCQYMAASLALQAALSQGGTDPYDPSKRITDSQITQVAGAGWKRKSTQSATYSNGDHWLFLEVTSRNGGSGGSKPGAFLVDLELSNVRDTTEVLPFLKEQTWLKEPVSLDTSTVTYVSSTGTTHQPTGMAACDPQLDDSAFFYVPIVQKISPGGFKCIRLKFTVTPPEGTSQYQLRIPKIILGNSTVDEVVATFGLIPE